MYSFKFDFQQKYATIYAAIDLRDKIRNYIDKIYFSCGIFVDFQKGLILKTTIFY